MMSLKASAVWRDWRPALLMQLRPWGWLAHLLEPHIGGRDEDGMRSLRLETGKALSHAPDSLVAAAKSLARALGSGAAFRSSS